MNTNSTKSAPAPISPEKRGAEKGLSNAYRELSKDWDPRRNPIVEYADAQSDVRGSILPLADETMRSAVLISSKKGTVRANHYHHTDWHYCYLIRGAIDYHYRPAGSQEKAACVRIRPGQVFFTPPMVEHAMVFIEDSEFLCLGRNSRDQATYEADITRVELVRV